MHLHLLYQEFPIDELLHNGEEDPIPVATNNDEYVFFYCDKFLRLIESDCI